MTWKTDLAIWRMEEGKLWILTRTESHKWDGTDGSKLWDVSALVWIYDYNTTGTHKQWEMTRMKLKVLFTVAEYRDKGGIFKKGARTDSVAIKVIMIIMLMLSNILSGGSSV